MTHNNWQASALHSCPAKSWSCSGRRARRRRSSGGGPPVRISVSAIFDPVPNARNAKGLSSLSTDCGSDLDWAITVSPCDPPPAVHGGSRRLAGGGEPTCSRAPPRTHLPPPESAYGTSSHPGTAAAQSRWCPAPPPAVTIQSSSGQQVKGAGSHQDTLTPTRR